MRKIRNFPRLKLLLLRGLRWGWNARDTTHAFLFQKVVCSYRDTDSKTSHLFFLLSTADFTRLFSSCSLRELNSSDRFKRHTQNHPTFLRRGREIDTSSSFDLQLDIERCA
jgi:hypothetical protein